jgi:hypothetical protein
VISRNVISALVQSAIIVPMMVLIVFGAGRLLGSMGDTTGSVWLNRLAVLGGLVWTIGLVLLLVALGINAARPHDEG